MSRYTTEVRYICETYAGFSESVGYSDIESVIKNSIAKVFDFDFPIFDEKYRGVLETKILRHYYTREIAHETVGLWKLKLNTKMNDIMPYYNKLYESELLAFNPLFDVDITRQRKVDSSGKTNSVTKSSVETSNETDRNVDNSISNETSTTDSTNNTETGVRKQSFSDTPQGSISDLESGKYLTNATINNDNVNTVVNGNSTGKQTGSSESNESVESNGSTDSNSTSNVDITNLENYIETVKGKQGTQTYSSLIMEFRETFLNIDMMIINELEELFFGLWD